MNTDIKKNESDSNVNGSKPDLEKKSKNQNQPVERDKKLIWIFFTISISLIILSAFPLYFLLESSYDLGGQSMLRYTLFLLLGMSIASFSLGVLHSYAKFSGPLFRGELQLGGAIVIIALVVVLGTQFTDIGTGVTPFKLTIVKEFSDNLSDRNLTIQRVLPINFDKENIAPTLYDTLSRKGVYSINTINLTSCNIFKAFIRPSNSLITTSLPNNNMNAELTFKIDKEKLAKVNRPELIVYVDKNMNIQIDKTNNDVSWLDEKVADNIGFNLESLFYSTAQASILLQVTGLTVPNFETIKNQYLLKKEGYVEFNILINSKILTKTNKVNYSIYVNNTPIYIDGQSKSFIYTNAKPKALISFGLNDSVLQGFSSQECRIIISMDFFQGDNLVSEKRIEKVFSPTELAEDVIFDQKLFIFNWSETYHPGR